MSDVAFNEIAESYDSQFTHSTLGKLQRARVWKYLNQCYPQSAPLDILELNCGTGEDAIFMAKFGHNVLATDVSSKMLQVVKEKLNTVKQSISLELEILDLQNLPELSKKFDLVFSNFGGINCLNSKDLILLNRFIEKHLKPKGQCIFVIMPQNTLLAKWYRKFKSEDAVYEARKKPEGIQVRLHQESVTTYYHNRSHIMNCFKSFELVKTFGIGYVPSYLGQSKYIKVLTWMDKVFNTFNLNPNLSDHYLIHLRKQ